MVARRINVCNQPINAFIAICRNLGAIARHGLARGGWFGVKRINGFSDAWPENLQVNDHLDFFTVEHLSPKMLTLTVRDKHLDVMTCISLDDEILTITSSVKAHNLYGRIYMIPVGPAHRLIVRKDLEHINRHLNK